LNTQNILNIMNIQLNEVSEQESLSNTILLLLVTREADETIISKLTIANESDIPILLKEIFHSVAMNEFLRLPIQYLSKTNLNNATIKKIFTDINHWKLNKTQYTEAINYVFTIIERTLPIYSTPSYINELLIKLLEPIGGTFYSGTLGIASTMIMAYQYAAYLGNTLEIYGQEINLQIYALAVIRLYVNGISSHHILASDMLTSPIINNFDYIAIHPPANIEWKDKQSQIIDRPDLYSFGFPQVTTSDWLFLSLALKLLNKTGKAVVLTPVGSLFRTGMEEKLRTRVIYCDYIEAIIELPERIVTNSSTNFAIIIFNKNKSIKLKNSIQFIDATQLYESQKRAKRALSIDNINEIVNIYKSQTDIVNLSTIVSLTNLRSSNILPSKYVTKTSFLSNIYGEIKLSMPNIVSNKTLDDVGIFFRGINILRSYLQNPNGDFRVINLANVEDGEINMATLTTYEVDNRARLDMYRVQEGNLIISNRGTLKICIVPKHKGNLLISQNFIGLRLHKGYNPEYIKQFLQSPLGEYLINTKRAGSASQIINIRDLKEIPFIEPLTQNQTEIIDSYNTKQQQIVTKIEKLELELLTMRNKLYDQMGISKFFQL